MVACTRTLCRTCRGYPVVDRYVRNAAITPPRDYFTRIVLPICVYREARWNCAKVAELDQRIWPTSLLADCCRKNDYRRLTTLTIFLLQKNFVTFIGKSKKYLCIKKNDQFPSLKILLTSTSSLKLKLHDYREYCILRWTFSCWRFLRAINNIFPSDWEISS